MYSNSTARKFFWCLPCFELPYKGFKRHTNISNTKLVSKYQNYKEDPVGIPDHMILTVSVLRLRKGSSNLYDKNNVVSIE